MASAKDVYKRQHTAPALTHGVGVYVYVVVIDVFGDIGKQLAADLIGLAVENDQIDRHIVVQQKFPNGVHRHPKRLIFWIAVDAGGNQRKSHQMCIRDRL